VKCLETKFIRMCIRFLYVQAVFNASISCCATNVQDLLQINLLTLFVVVASLIPSILSKLQQVHC
jgi:hypothetical protein